MQVSGMNEKASNDNLEKIPNKFEDQKSSAGRKEEASIDDLSKKPRDVKRPIVLTACLIIDIIISLLSFLMIVHLAINPPSFPKLEAFQNVGKFFMEQLMIASTNGVVSLAFCFVTGMGLFIYSSVVVRQAWKIYRRKEAGFLDGSVNETKSIFYV